MALFHHHLHSNRSCLALVFDMPSTWIKLHFFLWNFDVPCMGCSHLWWTMHHYGHVQNTQIPMSKNKYYPPVNHHHHTIGVPHRLNIMYFVRTIPPLKNDNRSTLTFVSSTSVKAKLGIKSVQSYLKVTFFKWWHGIHYDKKILQEFIAHVISMTQ
jgi:hypothetical protein